MKGGSAVQIFLTVKHYFPVDLCILNQLGWFDTEGQAVEDVMTSDLMTLPTEVSANLSEEKVGACAEKIVNKMSQRNKR